ncbi:Gti1/Pac2 family-domain-containing protein [Irpex rosettiformis]|uniref:Gti1/Pac2 family-domain-containing protein n=1 Tax=Irpex rosettiformis TaxID=378272 RepID=A0ACB8TXY3_9APHY|nr:Gti1/Pac2 family-domain-containing protein [Irpex rosettiformis]
MSHDNHPAAGSSAASQQNPPPNTWTEPPWSGWIETTGDALLILEAARRGLIPRVTRRLVDSERKMITSGSVFVFDEDESGIKRWTDGFFWSPSRILGNFLLYRETEKRGAGHRTARTEREPVNDQYEAVGGVKTESGQSLSRPKSETTRLGIDRQRERSLVGSLTNSYKFKPGGMMKKTFSLTIGGVAQHLISYYKVEDVEQGRLRSPSTLPELASLDISPEYLDKTHFRNPPKVEVGVDGIPRYRGEADDIETSPSLATHLTLPTFDESSLNKRPSTKRYDPYSPSPTSPAIIKRPRKLKNGSMHSRSQDADDPGSPTSNPSTSYTSSHPPPPPPASSSTGYPESLSMTTTGTVAYPPYGYYPPPSTSYHGPPVYSPNSYIPQTATGHAQQPASPIAPQQTPTPPGQHQVTYTGFTSSTSSHSQTSTHGPSQSTGSTQGQSSYSSYYTPQQQGYGGYAATTGGNGMWPPPAQYSGSGYSQGNGRVQKTEREGSV